MVTSPVNGFIGKRMLDPGAWVTPNSSFISVVDIGVVRLVANVIEKDLRRISAGQQADVSVDAFPDEHFGGRIARVSPVLDPATRTAQIEVEINNAQFRLKPGMYAKVGFTVERHAQRARSCRPTRSWTTKGRRASSCRAARATRRISRPIQLGLISQEQIEVASGLSEGDKVVTTGAGALREGDRILLPGQNADARGGRGGRGGRGRRRRTADSRGQRAAASRATGQLTRGRGIAEADS